MRKYKWKPIDFVDFKNGDETITGIQSVGKGRSYLWGLIKMRDEELYISTAKGIYNLRRIDDK